VGRIRMKEARIGIVGLGYVGLPLALAFAHNGFTTVGLEVDESKARSLNQGRSYLGDISDAEVAQELISERFRATTDASVLQECDCIIICVPTPLSRTNDPDLSFIQSATETVKEHLRAGRLVVLESTTYPGCTDELVLVELEQTGLKLDRDFLLAFSPERIDPGNTSYKTVDIPRIVGGCSADSTAAAAELYAQAVPNVHIVSSARVAETAKLLENTFRAVNIGLVNEMALMCYRMNIDIWEVIEAAKTKPYGFMPFYPGPGIGGHCIPLDPAYLSWRGRQFGFESRFIDLAEGVNASMPGYVVQLVADALNSQGKPLNGARVVVLGVAYKKDVADLRESPALEIIQDLRAKKANVAYHDPFVSKVDFSHAAAKLRREMMYGGAERRAEQTSRIPGSDGTYGRRSADTLYSVPLANELLAQSDCVVIVTDHSSIDYERIVQTASLVVDTRHAITEDLRRRSSAQIVRL
jgi:UDP-N-acetyl-D-glucosamine dehydrogenase